MKEKRIEPAGTITIRASVTLKELWKEFRAEALKRDLTVPQALEEAIKLWIEKKEEEAKQNTA